MTYMTCSPKLSGRPRIYVMDVMPQAERSGECQARSGNMSCHVYGECQARSGNGSEWQQEHKGEFLYVPLGPSGTVLTQGTPQVLCSRGEQATRGDSGTHR